MEKVKKINIDNINKSFSESARIIDYRLTEVGRQNWEVCERMLAHDLVDMAYIPEVKALLDYYSIMILPNGAHTLSLPRKMIKRFSEKSKSKK